MAGMNPEKKTHDSIERANRKILDEHDRRLKQWQDERLKALERARKEANAGNSHAPSLI